MPQQGLVLGFQRSRAQDGDRRVPVLAVGRLVPQVGGRGQHRDPVDPLGHTHDRPGQPGLLGSQVGHLGLHVALHVRRPHGVGHVREGGADVIGQHLARLRVSNWFAQPLRGVSATSSVRSRIRDHATNASVSPNTKTSGCKKLNGMKKTCTTIHAMIPQPKATVRASA